MVQCVASECSPKLMINANISILSGIAAEYGLSTNELSHRALQQLLRLSRKELQDWVIVSKEAERVAQLVKRTRNKYKCLFETPKERINLTELSFKKVPDNLARVVNKELHYIGYNRSRSVFLGLFLDNSRYHGKLVSMITISPFDLHHVSPFLPEGVDFQNVLVVSRTFAFDWAPRNCISYMMGRTFRWLKQNEPHVKLLLTYLNPNLCFSGASYKAANWILFGREPNLRYAYLDKNYITLRELRKKFRTSDLVVLKKSLRNRLKLSECKLGPLEIYAYFLDKRLRPRCREPIDFQKEPPIA